MPKAPTTFEDLRNAVRTEREALTLAAVLPNLPDDDRVIDLRGQADGYTGRVHYDTDGPTLEAFRSHVPAIVPGSDLYRVRIDTKDGKNANGDDDALYLGVEPVPHGRGTYAIDRRDFAEFVSVDPEDAEYDGTGQATLDRYGFGNPYYNPYEANRDAFGRDPHLPV